MSETYSEHRALHCQYGGAERGVPCTCGVMASSPEPTEAMVEAGYQALTRVAVTKRDTEIILRAALAVSPGCRGAELDQGHPLGDAIVDLCALRHLAGGDPLDRAIGRVEDEWARATGFGPVDVGEGGSDG